MVGAKSVSFEVHLQLKIQFLGKMGTLEGLWSSRLLELISLIWIRNLLIISAP